MTTDPIRLRVVQVKTADPAGMWVRALAADDSGHSIEVRLPVSDRPYVGQPVVATVTFETGPVVARVPS